MSKKLITVTVMSPLSSIVLNAKWLDVNSASGNFVVQPGHSPLIITLASKKDLIIGLDDNTQKVIKIGDGILKVDRDSAMVLITNEIAESELDAKKEVV